MIKDGRTKNNNRNTSFYKSKIEKTKREKNDFFERSRRRQMSSYFRAVAVVAVFMVVIAGFIALGVWLKNLTAEEPEYSFSAMTENPEADIVIPTSENEEPCEISEIFNNFQGVYLDAEKLADLDDLQNFIDRIKLKDINAVVIDIKKDDGVIPFRINGQFTAVVGEHNEIDLKIQDILAMLHDNDIYVSGRIACFKDDLASTYFPVDALNETQTGLRFSDASGSAWLNIYSEGARNYILDLITASVQLGFNEIILDYFYLPDADASRLIYNDGGIGKNDAVKIFIMEVRELLGELTPNIKFGLNFPIHNFLNMPISVMGLNPDELVNLCDFFTTSFAPSDLPQGALNLTNPESSPYETVKTLGTRFSGIAERTTLRPYLQAFDSAGGVVYGNDQILSQRGALRETGILVWTLVNHDNNY